VNMPDRNEIERLRERVTELEAVLKRIVIRWEGHDDCTAAVAHARSLLARLEQKP
jgi:hypothetical protein